jgi:hypothetical protein
MTPETFKKRFDFPFNLLIGCKNIVLDGRNGKTYNITFNRRNEPIAKLLKPIRKEMTINSDSSSRNNGYKTSERIIIWCGIALIITVILMVIFN